MNAPAKATSPPAAPVDPSLWLLRIPKVRQTNTIALPDRLDPNNESAVSVTERWKTVQLKVTDKLGVERSVIMTLAEARKLSEYLNTACRRVARRPANRP
jgi:hypothetical protein